VSLLLLLQLLLLLLVSDPALPAANLAAVHCAVERDVVGLLDSQDSHKSFTQWNRENTYILRARGNLGLNKSTSYALDRILVAWKLSPRKT